MCQMIVFDLLCIVGHRFEGWFGSAEDFASQKERRLLACPSCGSAAVERVPSASRVNLGALEPKPPKKHETPTDPVSCFFGAFPRRPPLRGGMRRFTPQFVSRRL